MMNTVASWGWGSFVRVTILGAMVACCSEGRKTETTATPQDNGCRSAQSETIALEVDSTALRSDLTFIAAPRTPGSEHWQAVQDLCFSRLTSLGFSVERQDYGSGVNIIGKRLGNTLANEQVWLGAHYDSVSDCDGADDNGTGVAGVLEAARVLSAFSFPRTLVIACWDEEETGYGGSSASAARALTDSATIRGVVVFEMIGFTDPRDNAQGMPEGFEMLFRDATAWLSARQYRGDFLTVVADASAHGVVQQVACHADQLALPSLALELTAAQKKSPIFGDLRRSDHSRFWDIDVPAVMLTDTAEFRNPGYHCDLQPDSISSLDLDFTTNVVRATSAALADLLN